MLLLAEIGRNEHREGAHHFTFALINIKKGGDPNGTPKPTSYLAYWNMIKKNESDRRRRTADGKLIVRHHSMKTRRRRRNVHKEHYINEVLSPKKQKNKKSYLRFQNSLGKVIVAETRHLKGKGNIERANYEFAQNGQVWDTEEEALEEKARRVADCYANAGNQGTGKCKAMEESGAARTQIGYGSDTIMRTFTGKLELLLNLRNRIDLIIGRVTLTLAIIRLC